MRTQSVAEEHPKSWRDRVRKTAVEPLYAAAGLELTDGAAQPYVNAFGSLTVDEIKAGVTAFLKHEPRGRKRLPSPSEFYRGWKTPAPFTVLDDDLTTAAEKTQRAYPKAVAVMTRKLVLLKDPAARAALLRAFVQETPMSVRAEERYLREARKYETRMEQGGARYLCPTCEGHRWRLVASVMDGEAAGTSRPCAYCEGTGEVAADRALGRPAQPPSGAVALPDPSAPTVLADQVAAVELTDAALARALETLRAALAERLASNASDKAIAARAARIAEARAMVQTQRGPEETEQVLERIRAESSGSASGQGEAW